MALTQSSKRGCNWLSAASRPLPAVRAPPQAPARAGALATVPTIDVPRGVRALESARTTRTPPPIRSSSGHGVKGVVQGNGGPITNSRGVWLIGLNGDGAPTEPLWHTHPPPQNRCTGHRSPRPQLLIPRSAQEMRNVPAQQLQFEDASAFSRTPQRHGVLQSYGALPL